MKLLRIAIPSLATLFCPTVMRAPTFTPIRIVWETPTVEDVQRVVSRWENCAALLNPGCLRFSFQRGATRNTFGYARFRKLSDGREALHDLLWRRMDRYRLFNALAVFGSRDSVLHELRAEGFNVQ